VGKPYSLEVGIEEPGHHQSYDDATHQVQSVLEPEVVSILKHGPHLSPKERIGPSASEEIANAQVEWSGIKVFADPEGEQSGGG